MVIYSSESSPNPRSSIEVGHIICLCNPDVVSLLEAVRGHHCFGCIHRFACTIIAINIYYVHMLFEV